jgi:hypothetical protein
MYYQILAQTKARDALREADKNRLVRVAVQSRNTQIRKQLIILARRFGLIKT